MHTALLRHWKRSLALSLTTMALGTGIAFAMQRTAGPSPSISEEDCCYPGSPCCAPGAPCCARARARGQNAVPQH